MGIVDDRGRLWGRFNLLDAVVALLILGLVPLGYGAYALFRTPPPRLTAIEPATLTAGPNLRVMIRGEKLRPYLRVTFGTTQGMNFLFMDNTRALVELNPMPPGVYDVVLYDFGQERMRLPNALTIVAPEALMPATRVVVVGKFTNLKPEQVPRIKPGVRVADDGQIVETAKAVPAKPKVYAGPIVGLPVKDRLELPAILELSCVVRAPGGQPECGGADFALRPTAIVTLSTPLGPLPFQIDQVRGLQRLETIRVAARFTGRPEVLEQIRQGDVDTSIADNPLAAGATVENVFPVRRASDQAAEREVAFSVRAQPAAAGWVYSNGHLRAAGAFPFVTPGYELHGQVLSITPRLNRTTSAR